MPKLKALSLLLVLLAVVSLGCGGSKSKSSTATVTGTGTPSADSTLTPTADAVQVTVSLDFAGASTAQPAVKQTVSVPANTTAWDAIRKAIGDSNITFTDYGGTLGVFITAFYNLTPSGNKFWEFSVNGKSSDVGVSTYIVQDKDSLEFKITSS